MKTYYVYIATNRGRTLYIRVTNELTRRQSEHAMGTSRFTAKYNIGRIVYYETYMDIRQAIAREKEIKGWRRSKKIAFDRKYESKLDGGGHCMATVVVPPTPPVPSLTLGVTTGEP